MNPISAANIGTTELVFTTVEFLDSANEALPVPDSVRSDGKNS